MSRYLTLVAVGDRNSNKTELLIKYTGGRDCSKRQDNLVVPRFQNNVHSIIVDRIPWTIHFIDTECDDGYDTLRQQTYEKADCILMCYSIKLKSSFKNIFKKWVLEARKHAPFVPIVLVGTAIENRDETTGISTRQGENLKLLIGAYAFVECSIPLFLNVDDVFIEAVRSTYERKIKF